MSLVWAGFVVISFALLIQGFRLGPRAKQVGDYTHDALRILTDRQLDDRTKERLLRSHAGRLFLAGATILLGGCAAVAIPLGVVWLMDRYGLASLSSVAAVLERLDFLVAISLLGGMAYWGLKKRNRT